MELERTIDENMENMAASSRFANALLQESDVLATARGDEADALRSRIPDEESTLRGEYLGIPREERFRAWRVAFTRPSLDEFADEWSFRLFLEDLAFRRPELEDRTRTWVR